MTEPIYFSVFFSHFFWEFLGKIFYYNVEKAGAIFHGRMAVRRHPSQPWRGEK
jgi:hypothetical protein